MRVVAALLLGTLSACAKEELVHGLTELEANEIVYVLEAGNIKSIKEKEEGGRTVTYKVAVAAADAFGGRKMLVENQLPRVNPWGLAKIYDPANKGMIPTATEEEAAYIMALQGEISMKLRSIPGVVDAHVTVVKPKRDVVRDLSDKPPPATASVTVLYNQVEGRVPFKMDEIQRLVAGSVEGMDWQNVTVVANLNRAMSKRLSGVNAEPGEEEGGALDKRAMPKAWGNITVADEAERKKLNIILGGAGITLLVAIVGLLLAVVSYFTKSRQLATVSTELTSFRKAKRAAAEGPPAG